MSRCDPSRPFAAAVMGVAFIIVYIAAAITLPDLLPQHWAVQAVYTSWSPAWCGCSRSAG